jgi:hypothetical protein
MRASHAVAFLLIATVAAACARTEFARFQAKDGQQAMVRDGRPAIVSRRASSLVLVSPSTRQFKAGNRSTYVVAINNLTGKPIDFSVGNLWVGQVINGQVANQLKVYTYEDLVAEERNRQIVRAVAAGSPPEQTRIPRPTLDTTTPTPPLPALAGQATSILLATIPQLRRSLRRMQPHKMKR